MKAKPFSAIARSAIGVAAALLGPARFAAAAQSPAASAPIMVPPPAPDGLRVASVPLLILPPDQAQRGDPLWLHGDVVPGANVIARARLRPVDAIVVDQNLGQGAGRPLILWLALAGPTEWLVDRSEARPTSTSHSRLFCGDGEAFQGRILCFVDRNRDGRLEGVARGLSEGGREMRQLSLVGPTAPLPAPIAYRAAREDELPTIDVEFQGCAPHGGRPGYRAVVAGAAPQVSAAMPRAEFAGEGIVNPLLCQRAQSVESHDTLYREGSAGGGQALRLGELVIGVVRSDHDSSVARVAGLRNPDRLYRITGNVVSPISETLIESQRRAAIEQRVSRPVLMFAAAPTVNEGARAAGEIVMTVPLRHGYTGVLTGPVEVHNILVNWQLPAGTLVYGVPVIIREAVAINNALIHTSSAVATADDYRFLWCTPVEYHGQWSATCVIEDEGGYRMIEGQRPAFEAPGADFLHAPFNRSALQMAQREADFGRPLSYRFTLTSISPTEFVIARDTMFGDSVTDHFERSVARMSGRPTVVRIAGGSISFADAPDGRLEVRLNEAFQLGTSASAFEGAPGNPGKK
jgi:hypothetical protein